VQYFIINCVADDDCQSEDSDYADFELLSKGRVSSEPTLDIGM